VREFVYLGSTFNPDGLLTTEISHRIGLARLAFAQLSKLWKKHDVATKVKMRVFKAIIPPTLLYGCESWALTEPQLRQLDVFLHNCLRSVLGIRQGTHVTNINLRKRCHHPDIPTIIRNHRLRFLGHIARRHPHRLPKILLFATHIPNITTNPRQGGHYITALLKQDLEALGKYHGWYLAAQDRVAWRTMLKEAFELDNDSTTAAA
jgi:hypothetical protein